MTEITPTHAETLAVVDQRLQRCKAVAVDTETDGLDWRKNKVVGFVFNFGPTPQDAFYLPIRHGGGSNMDPKKVLKLVRDGMKRPQSRKIFFNAHFDLRMMHPDKIEVNGPIEDAQINAYLIDERQRSFSLDACCEFARVRPKKGEELYKHLAAKFGGEPNRDQMGNYWKLAGDDPIGLDYALGDGISTWELWEKQQPILDGEDLRRVWDIECRLIPVLVRMMLLGIRVDEDRLHDVKLLVETALTKSRKMLPKNFNAAAPSQLKKLFTDAGVTDWPTTEKGNASFTESWLQHSEIGQAVVAVRKLQHLIDSFFTPLIERHLWHGRVHCSYNQTRGEEFGTISGRLSCNDPNMQQIHKRNKVLGSLFRSIFIPDSGKRWRSADYKQIEPRLLAHYGMVRVLLEGYRADPPVDAHQAVATAARIDRESGKRLNQAMLTGAGRAKVAMMLDMVMNEAGPIIDSYHRNMPEIKIFQRQAADIWIQRGYLRSILGRRARLDDPRFAYKGVSRILQMSNADILKKSMVEIDDYLQANNTGIDMLINIHDDEGFQYVPGTDDAAMSDCMDIMRDYGPGKSITLELPMEVDVGEGNNWAEATYGAETVRKSFKEMRGRY